MKIKVLFVCLGNICRSPVAEGVFKDLVKRKKADTYFEIDSCGTSNYHIGQQPDKRSTENALKNGIKLHHKARQLTAQDIYNFDYIIAMDEMNKADVMRLCDKKEQKIKIFLFREFQKNANSFSVPDPYYGGKGGFQQVFDMLKDCSLGLFEFIVKKEELNI